MTQLDKNIAFNLKRIRKSKNMSLDMLAERTGVSKSMLGQIERGESNPTVSTIGKIVDGLKVPFEQLIYDRQEFMVMPSLEEAPVFRVKEGEYRIYVMLPYDVGRNFEIYQGEVVPGAQMESESHGENTWEYLTVVSGEVAWNMAVLILSPFPPLTSIISKNSPAFSIFHGPIPRCFS